MEIRSILSCYYCMASASRSLVDTYLRLHSAFYHHIHAALHSSPGPCAILPKVRRKPVPDKGPSERGNHSGQANVALIASLCAPTDHIEDLPMMGNLEISSELSVSLARSNGTLFLNISIPHQGHLVANVTDWVPVVGTRR